jgi:hypothetical protein
MFANLDRDEFITLLERLGSEDDTEVLNAARDLHARVAVAELSWDDLLVPEGGVLSPEDGEVEEDHLYDDELSDGAGETVETVETAPSEDGGDKPVSAEEKAEALGLIAKIEALEISEDTKADLADYKSDLESGDFLVMDLRYLRAFHKRLGK